MIIVDDGRPKDDYVQHADEYPGKRPEIKVPKPEKLYEYKGRLYPEYLRNWNAQGYVQQFALFFCEGKGLDIGAGKWPLPGAMAIDIGKDDARNVPECKTGQGWDYIFSSHCLEHIGNPIVALEHWIDRLAPGGCLFVHLPHPDMKYWKPQNCRKHLHTWRPEDMREIFADLGLWKIIGSERDMYWSFTTVGWKP